jgi:eukaryotic-like serine/threonine-protein kinase
MQNKVDTFCMFQALSNRQRRISGKLNESGRISARQRALFEPTRWTHPASKKLQRVCDRWYSLGVIFGNRGGMLGCGHFPPYILRNPPPELEFRQCNYSCGRRNSTGAYLPMRNCPARLARYRFLNKRFVGLGAMATQPEFVEQLFESALALKPADRAAFLDQACSHDPELRRTVEELLAEDANAGSLLEHPPFDLLGQERLCPGHVGGTTVSIGDNEVPSALPPAGRLTPGQVLINRFVILRFIAKGGMGEVYEAEDSFLQGVHVALKTILPQIADDPALRQRFEREVLLAREVSHPNLCPIYDIFHCDQPSDFLFLTMKLLAGETLASRLRRTTSLSIAEGMAILKQMAAGVAAIHAAGIIHRDIKPNNIMLDGIGSEVRLCITDFGLARAHEAEPSLLGKGLVAGTPDYIAPELYLGRPPSQATDLFALGVVLHEVFTGQKPTRAPEGSSVIVSPRLSNSGLPSLSVQLIVECLNPDPKRRCQAFERALGSLHIHYRTRELWTRRRFGGAAVAAIGAAAGAAWWKWDDVEDLLRPLPSKRFVALLNWPATSDIHVTPMLTSVLSAIKSELTRAETVDRNLFVISPEELNVNTTGVTHLKEVCDPLGANLVLAASGSPGTKHIQLFLRVLDPSTNQPLREKRLTCALAEITSLPGKAVRAVASLLNLEDYLQNGERAEPGTQSAAAFTAFQSAETLRKQPNDTGLDAAIEKYKQAVELDPRYAIAHAKLAQAYGRLYAVQRNPAALDLARGNCQVALTLDPGLVDAHLAQALILEISGNEQGALQEIAKALSLDPSNPKPLVWQAQIYTRLNRWGEAEKTLHRVLREHPNHWLAYNELGFGLEEQGRYQEALEAFRTASLAAPKNSMTLSNLSAEYIQVGQFAEAIETLKRSAALNPNSGQTTMFTSLALRYQGKYDEALRFARKAVQLRPGLDTYWLELGDCYLSLGNHQSEARDAYLRAAKEAEHHLAIDPTNGPSWLLLALYKVKSGSPQDAPSLMARAESLGASDMDSWLYKGRILELLGKREQALVTLAACFRRGATDVQIAAFPDMQSLRKDRRYRQLAESKSLASVSNHS